jgi:hypothetical protein
MHKIFVNSYRLWNIIPLACLALCLGCSAQPAATAPIVEDAGSDEPFEYAQVELSDPKFTVTEDGICNFEVRYKFVKGKIGENYMLTLKFPGTQNSCIKQMNSWHFTGPEGVIKDGIPLQEPNFSEYEFTFSEAEVPMDGYTLISNVLTGTYVKP